MKIFLTNLGKYNEGELIGEWVELPASSEELQEVFERIGINEEYEEESKVVKALMQKLGYTLDEAIERVNNGDYRIYYDCDDMEDVAYQVVEDCGYLDKVPDNVAYYFDYESFGKDLGIEGTYIFTDDNEAIEIF